MAFIFVTRQRDTGCLSELGAPKRRKYSSLFSTQLYTINVANLPNCCKISLAVMVALRRMFETAGSNLIPIAYSGSNY